METGMKIRRKAWEFNSTLLEINMKGVLKKENRMERGFSNGVMVRVTRVNGRTDLNMASVFGKIITANLTKVIGRWEKLMAKAIRSGAMVSTRIFL